jgi:hypothetical protein
VRALLASCLLLSALGACELEPPPKKAPAAAPTPPPTTPPPAAAPTPPPATPPANPNAPPPGPPPVVVDGAGSGSAALAPVSQPCLDVSDRIAAAMIAETTDPGKKAVLEQERTKIVRKSAEACTRNAWKPEVMKCFMDSKTTVEMQECAKTLQPPTDPE